MIRPGELGSASRGAMSHDGANMESTASRLANWALGLTPTATEIALADRALIDTTAVAVAALAEPVTALVADAPTAARWATIGHVLDYDDLHIPSTTHISVVCVPATLAAGGSGRAYLAGAGVMARVGRMLGWPHYSRGWHATCTAGALGAAVAAGVAYDLDAAALAQAIALAVPGAGGVQRSFGTMAKSVQVGFAAEAGVRAAQLARAGASADPAVVDQWLTLLRGDPADPRTVDALLTDPVAVPGGLAIKVFPCCYALQRPICAVASIKPLDPSSIVRIDVRTPSASVQPLIHHRPMDGLAAKFSLEYGIAAALLDGRTGFASFRDDAVRRPAAQDLLRVVTIDTADSSAAPAAVAHLDDTDLLVGQFDAKISLRDGTSRQVSLVDPLGAPARPLTDDELAEKVADCCGEDADAVLTATWDTALSQLDELASRRPRQ
jgi:2-methylcitrate dehydratase PrpD